MSVSREIDETDLKEYLNGFENGGIVDEGITNQYKLIQNMSSEDTFNALMSIELLYFRNLQKKREDIVTSVS